MLAPMSALIAIVGRPNVGKSALFNRIAGRRIAIVHDQPGVTRDRVTAEAEWLGRPFTLVDTGGIGLLRREKSEDVIQKATVDQVGLAIDAASVIIFVVNVQEGIVPLDREVADRLRASKKIVLVAVNKVDNHRADLGTGEFSALGFEKVFPVTAIHGTGINELMAEVLLRLPTYEPVVENRPEASEPPLKIAIVGRPNVGKSSIINALTKSQRVIVSEIPGTTRDAVDVPFDVETDGIRQRYLLIDTAGVRQRARVSDAVELYSVQRTDESIERCDLAIFVMDAEAGITTQDKKVAGKIEELRKACIIVVNKWDLMEQTVRKAREVVVQQRLAKKVSRSTDEKMTTLSDFAAWVQEKMFFLDYAPVIFTSAKSGFHLDRLLEAMRFVAANLKQKVPTAILNRTIQAAVEKQQPVSSHGHRLKFFYSTQVKESPPTFLLFVNNADLFTPVYRKYLGDQIRKAHGFEGCAINLIPKDRPKTIEAKRDRTRAPGAAAAAKRKAYVPFHGWSGKALAKETKPAGDRPPIARPARPAKPARVVRPGKPARPARPGRPGARSARGPQRRSDKRR